MTDKRLGQTRPNAWLLHFGNGYRAAVATRVLMHLIERPEIFAVPCTPEYCRSVAFWQERLLPVMDLAARLGAAPQQAPQLLVVVAYRDPPDGEIRFGALLLSEPPIPIVVGDEAACPLPEAPLAWNSLAISCFDHQGVPVPVLNLGRIFSAPDNLD